MKKHTRFQKFVIFGLSIFLLSVITLMGYLSFAYDETSDKLIQAKQELELGNKNKAYDIYFSIIAKDTSCEEAFRALANLAQERQNYKDAAYFWLMVSNLNPPDSQAKRDAVGATFGLPGGMNAKAFLAAVKCVATYEEYLVALRANDNPPSAE